MNCVLGVRSHDSPLVCRPVAVDFELRSISGRLAGSQSDRRRGGRGSSPRRSPHASRLETFWACRTGRGSFKHSSSSAASVLFAWTAAHVDVLMILMILVWGSYSLWVRGMWAVNKVWAVPPDAEPVDGGASGWVENIAPLCSYERVGSVSRNKQIWKHKTISTISVHLTSKQSSVSKHEACITFKGFCAFMRICGRKMELGKWRNHVCVWGCLEGSIYHSRRRKRPRHRVPGTAEGSSSSSVWSAWRLEKRGFSVSHVRAAKELREKAKKNGLCSECVGKFMLAVCAWRLEGDA